MLNVPMETKRLRLAWDGCGAMSDGGCVCERLCGLRGKERMQVVSMRSG